MAQVVENLPSKNKALSPKLSTAKKKKKDTDIDIKQEYSYFNPV
jgi:hypothetical protein